MYALILIWILTAVAAVSWVAVIYAAARKRWKVLCCLAVLALLISIAVIYLWAKFAEIMQGWMEIGSALD